MQAPLATTLAACSTTEPRFPSPLAAASARPLAPAARPLAAAALPAAQPSQPSGASRAAVCCVSGVGASAPSVSTADTQSHTSATVNSAIYKSGPTGERGAGST